MSSLSPPAPFVTRHDKGQAQIVWETFPADLETPVSAMLKVGVGRPYAFLLESVEGGTRRGRYCAIGLHPDVVWRARRGRVETWRRGPTGDLRKATPPGRDACDPLSSLRALIKDSHIALPDGLPPMVAGLFGYLGYGTIGWVETIGDDNPDRLGIPDAVLVRPTVMIVFDNVSDDVMIATPVRPDEDSDAQRAYTAAQDRIRACAKEVFATSLGPQPGLASAHSTSSDADPVPQSNMSADAYRAMVTRAKSYILAGDIFQVVLSQRFCVPFSLPPFSLYRALRRLNPSPFLFYIDFEDFTVVGSSPEILVRLRGRDVTIRPIAGTRKRGEDKALDDALAQNLLSDPKELAEHLMLLDLGRNDVGRVSQAGSVAVTDRMIVERYSHVMHLVSNVVGKLAPGMDALDALLAGFPAGTVSGAPKIRAMEIIEELEPERRGLYAGGVGYFSCDGDLDFCIALRTAVLKDGHMNVQAGGGVVAESSEQGEYEESRNKAHALIRAAAHATGFPLPDTT